MQNISDVEKVQQVCILHAAVKVSYILSSES